MDRGSRQLGRRTKGGRLTMLVLLSGTALAAESAAGAQGFPPAHASYIEVQDLGDSTVTSGLARDAVTGSPLEDVLVYPPPGLVGTISDNEGRFRLVLPDPRPSELRVEKLGYVRRDLEVPIDEGRMSFYAVEASLAFCDYVSIADTRPINAPQEAVDSSGPRAEPQPRMNTRVTVTLFDAESGGGIEQTVLVEVHRLDGPQGSITAEVSSSGRIHLPIRAPGVYMLRIEADGYDIAQTGPFVLPTVPCAPFDMDQHHQDLWLRRH